MPEAASIVFARYPTNLSRSKAVRDAPAGRTNPAPIAVIRADISRSHGITPAVIMLDVVPFDPGDLANGSRQGTLTAEYDGARLDIPYCLIDSRSVSLSIHGKVSSLTILDRRWKWRYGSISGHYNRRTESGKPIKSDDPAFKASSVLNSVKSPQELAKLLLDAMGETNYDASAMPTGMGPEVRWDADNPARELAELCEMFGCRIVYGWDERVRIYKIGQADGDSGSRRKWANRHERAAERRAQRLARLSGIRKNPPLPNPIPVIRFSEAVDIEDKPDEVHIETGPVLYQLDLELEAVGEDTDGTTKLLKDLSFAPNKKRADGGFGGDDAVFALHHGITLDTEDDDLRELARKTVFRWYRVKVPIELPKVSRFQDEQGQHRVSLMTITSLADIKPLVQYRATTTVEDGLVVDKDPLVYGRWFDGEMNNVTRILPLPKDEIKGSIIGVPASRLLVPAGYSIDTRKAIVKFREAMAVINADDTYSPAELRLRASFFVRDYFTGAWLTKTVRQATGAPYRGTQPLVIKRDDLTPIQVLSYFGSRFTDIQTEDNFDEIENLAIEHISAIEQTFVPSRPSEIVLAGFYPQIELDGVIRTVAFGIDANDTTAPITTTVQIDQDVPGVGQLAYVEMRQHERIMALRDHTKSLRTRQLRWEVQQNEAG